MFVTHRPSKNSQRLLTTKFFSDHITRREATRLNTTALLSRVAKVITSPDPTQLNQTVLLSCVGSGDVIKPLLSLNPSIYEDDI